MLHVWSFQALLQLVILVNLDLLPGAISLTAKHVSAIMLFGLI